MPQRSQPTNAPEPVAQQPTIDSTQSPSAEAVDAQIAPSTSLLRTASQTSPRQRRQMTAAISRVQGNQHLQRMIAALQRHTSEGIEEPENAIQRSVIQRHTSEGIEEPENAIQRLFIQRNLADDLTRAMDGIGTDEDAIWNAIDANPGERQGIMDDARIMARLRDELDREDMAKTLQKLGAPLADQINNAISGAGTDDTALWAAIGGAAADQKQMVLRNAALMRSLRDDLSQEDAGRAMRELGASLTEQIYAAIEGAGTEEQEIYDAISVAPADQKQAALRNRALMEALSDDMNQAEMLRALELLGASLADRLNMAMDGIGTDEDSIFAITAAATEAQRLEVRSNTTLMVRLRDELDQADMLRVMRSLASSVADRIDVALDGWGADDPAILALLTDATDAEQLQIKENTALVARMQNEMGEPTYAQVCSLIGLPVPGATPDAGATPAAGAPPDAGVAPDGGAAPAATPAEPQTLIGKVTAALDASPPNPAAAIAAITTATPADRATVREASALRDRLYAALSQAEVLNVMTLLEVPIGTRLGTLLDRSATSADIRAHITAATPVEKQAVLGDSVLLNRLIEAAGAADRDALMIALGDTLNNRIDQALLDTPTTAAVWALIRAADAAARASVVTNSTLMGRIDAAFDNHSYWQTRLLLEYGTEGAFPAAATTLVTALAGTPTYASIRATLSALSDADLTIAKTLVGLRDLLVTFVTAEEMQTISRMLDQGLIDEETLDEDWNETLEVDKDEGPGFNFESRTFTGNRGFDVAYYRDHVQVVVRIAFTYPFWDRQAAADKPRLVTNWKTNIEAGWDNIKSLRNAQRNLPIRISMIADAGSPHHTVNIDSRLDAKWPEYNTGNWCYRATAYAGVQNTAPLHEFGHMLGNPDEYNLSAVNYQATVGTNAATDPTATVVGTDPAGVTAYTSNSLMGGGGTIEPRHLNYFVNWINRHRRAGEPAYALV